MRVIGIAGWSGSGKTTLIVRLIPLLRARGRRVATIKHAHHDFDIDREGKDSFAHRQAGAESVLVASGRRWALMHELRDAPEPTLAELFARLPPADLVLVEGFKRDPIPKLEVHRPALGKPPLFPDDPRVVAVACDVPFYAGVLPVLPLDDASALADLVERRAIPLATAG